MKDITKFTTHGNNSKEIINATHINAIQKAVNETEKAIIVLYDENFKNKALYALEHNAKVNAMFMDTFDTPYRIFKSASENIEHVKDEKCVRPLKNSAIKSATFQSTKFTSNYSQHINKFILLVDADIPSGCKITYSISTDGISFFPIKEGGGLTTEIPSYGNAIYIRATLYKNAKSQYPRLFAWALLYYDDVIEQLSNIENVSFGDLEVESYGETTLVRDKTKNDKLVMVISPSSTTELQYDDQHDMRLSGVITRTSDKINTTTLKYGQYVTSKGDIEEVLLGLSTTNN